MVAVVPAQIRANKSAGTKSEISALQRISISLALRQRCSKLRQEINPRTIAVQAAQSIRSYLTDENWAALTHFANSASPYLLIRGAVDTSGLPGTPTNDA